MLHLHNVNAPWRTGRSKLQSLLLGNPWKHCTECGGTDVDTKPCIKVRFNDTQPNPLRKCNVDDDRIKNFGSNMIKAYQASFVFHHRTAPAVGYQISHICGRFQLPVNYKDTWSSCIEPSHMLSETKDQDAARKHCHHYIRIFKHKVMQNRPNGTKQTITVADVRQVTTAQDRRNIIKRLNIKQKPQYIDDLVNNICNCNVKNCFINYGDAVKITAIQQFRNINYQ